MFQQLTDCDPAVGLTVPDNVVGAYVSVDTADVRFRADGTAPTAAIGCLIVAGSGPVYLPGATFLEAVKFFGAGVVNVQYVYS